MRKTILAAVIFLSLIPIWAQTEDQKITEIRQIYKETAERIAEAEKSFPESDIFFSEMTVNKGGTMYPAVGNFKENIRFYYTYGNREENPYPNRLLKITVSTERAAQTEYAEFLFNSTGQLIFYFEKMGETENRLYLSAGKLIRWQKEQKIADIRGREAQEMSKAALARNEKVRQIFLNSLD